MDNSSGITEIFINATAHSKCMKTECAWCQKILERLPYRAKGRNYCNNSCKNFYEYKHGIKDPKEITKKANEARRKKGLEKFKTNPTKYIGKRGYWLIYVPGRGQVKYHHYVWEKNYGSVPEGYALHHINFDKLDNRIENLQMMPKREHHKLHDRLRKRDNNNRYL